MYKALGGICFLFKVTSRNLGTVEYVVVLNCFFSLSQRRSSHKKFGIHCPKYRNRNTRLDWTNQDRGLGWWAYLLGSFISVAPVG